MLTADVLTLMQVVVDRMFRRVLTFAGLPVFTGLVLFPVFWYFRVKCSASNAR